MLVHAITEKQSDPLFAAALFHFPGKFQRIDEGDTFQAMIPFNGGRQSYGWLAAVLALGLGGEILLAMNEASWSLWPGLLLLAVACGLFIRHCPPETGLTPGNGTLSPGLEWVTAVSLLVLAAEFYSGNYKRNFCKIFLSYFLIGPSDDIISMTFTAFTGP